MRRSSILLPLGLCLACGGGLGSGSRGQGAAPPIGELQQGIATYYTSADGDGACTFGPSPDDLDVAAMNDEQWEASRVCGACAAVTGPKGQVLVRIVDHCPGCKKGHLDLSPQAFGKIADISEGVVDITWQLQKCNVSGNVRYALMEGSNEWWLSIQVRNHRVPIDSLAYQKSGAWVDIPRSDYNQFVVEGGTGTGAIGLRATAWDGQVLEDVLPGPSVAVYEGHAQFQ